MNSVETAPPTFWVGRVGRAQLGELLLEPLELAQPPVVRRVVERGVVEDEVAPAGVLDLLAQRAVALLGLGSRRLRFAHGAYPANQRRHPPADPGRHAPPRLRTRSPIRDRPSYRIVGVETTLKERTLPTPSLTPYDASGQHPRDGAGAPRRQGAVAAPR